MNETERRLNGTLERRYSEALRGIPAPGSGCHAALLDNVDELLEANQRIGELQAQLRAASSWRARLKDHLTSGLIGAVIGWILGKII